MDALNEFMLQELASCYARIDMLMKWNARYRQDNLTLSRQNDWMSNQWDLEHEENERLRYEVQNLTGQVIQLTAILNLQNHNTDIDTESEMSEFSMSSSDGSIWACCRALGARGQTPLAHRHS
jgi:hypothetical protein